MSHPSNPTHHTCCDCGYVWEHGQHGGHSCSDLLLKKIENLERKMNPRLWTTSESEAWHSAIPNVQKAFTKLFNQ